MAVVDIVWEVVKKCDWVTVTPLSGTGNTFVEIRVEEAPMQAEYHESDLKCDVVFEATINGVSRSATTCVERCPRQCTCPGDFFVTPVGVLPQSSGNQVLIGKYSGSEEFMDMCLVGPSVIKPQCGCNVLKIFEGNENDDDTPIEEPTDDSWVNSIKFDNGNIYADIDKNPSEDPRTVYIDIYYGSGPNNACEPIKLKVTQSGSHCLCDNFDVNEVPTITNNGPLDGVTIGTYNFDVESTTSCYKILNTTTNCNWVTNIAFSNGNVTASIGEVTEFNVERSCVVTVRYKADIDSSCELQFTVKQKVTYIPPQPECSCDNVHITTKQIETKSITADKDSLPCVGGDIQFDLITSGDFTMLTYEDNEDGSTQFMAAERKLIGYYTLGDCAEESKLSFAAAPDNGNTKVCLEWNGGEIYAYINGLITSKERGNGVKIIVSYDGEVCNDVSFYIDVVSTSYRFEVTNHPECGGGNYTFKAIIQG